MKLPAAVCLAFQLSGCAITYVDADGATRRIGLLSITEKAGSCSLVRTITTAGISLDTSAANAGLNIGYRSVTTTMAPEQGMVSFDMGQDGQLASYERIGPVLPDGRISCP